MYRADLIGDILSFMNRRQFGLLAAASLPNARSQAKPLPIGLQQTAVSRNIQRDLTGTVRAICKMGYDLV